MLKKQYSIFENSQCGEVEFSHPHFKVRTLMNLPWRSCIDAYHDTSLRRYLAARYESTTSMNGTDASGMTGMYQWIRGWIP